jgi:hypothetical protein
VYIGPSSSALVVTLAVVEELQEQLLTQEEELNRREGAIMAISSSSSVEYLMTLFRARKCCGDHTSHMLLLSAFSPGPSGLRLHPSQSLHLS